MCFDAATEYTPSVSHPATDLLSVRDTAQSLLEQAGVMESTWRVQHVRRVTKRTVVLEVGPSEGKGIALEWTEHEGQDVPAFVRGDTYAVGYRNAPSAWDVDDLETPEAVKRAAEPAKRSLKRPPLFACPNPRSSRSTRVGFASTPMRLGLGWLSDSP